MTTFLMHAMTCSALIALGVPIASGQYEDLMAGGIIDPTKVIRCCLENSVSVAKVFLTSDVVVCDIPEEVGHP